jgi:hypothetical protein
MDLKDGRDCLIRDDPEEFAQATVELYTNSHMWATLSEGGQRLVKNRWTPDITRQRLAGLLETAAATWADRSSLKARANSG